MKETNMIQYLLKAEYLSSTGWKWLLLVTLCLVVVLLSGCASNITRSTALSDSQIRTIKDQMSEEAAVSIIRRHIEKRVEEINERRLSCLKSRFDVVKYMDPEQEKNFYPCVDRCSGMAQAKAQADCLTQCFPRQIPVSGLDGGRCTVELRLGSINRSGFAVQYVGPGSYSLDRKYTVPAGYRKTETHVVYKYYITSTDNTISFAAVRAISHRVIRPGNKPNYPQYTLYDGENKALYEFYPSKEEEKELLAALFVLCPNVQ